MTDRFGLPEQAIAKICSVFSQYPAINKVMLYGSRAKGNYRTGSDIDLSIDGDINLSDLLKIENQLDDLLLPWSIDLSILSQIDNQELAEHIRRCGTPIC